MDIEKLIERSKKVGLSEVPLSLDERESAVEIIFTTYQKPLDIEFVKSVLYQADIKVPNLNNVFHLMKKARKLKHVSRGVYQATATEPNTVTSRVHKKFLDSMGKMFSLKEELSQRENDIEQLQSQVDNMRREKRKFEQISDGA